MVRLSPLVVACCALLVACATDPVASPGNDVSTSDAGSGESDVSDSTVAPAPELQFTALTLEGDRHRVTDMAFLPGGAELLLIEKSGTVAHYTLDGDTASLLGEFVVPGIDDGNDCGLLSLAVDPGFEDNSLFYIGLCVSAQESQIRRYTLDATDYEGVPISEALIQSVVEPAADKLEHAVGSIGFDDEGVMWALYGEKWQKPKAQDTTSPLGSLHRFVPNREPGGSGLEPAAGNAFDGSGDDLATLYAWGLRSPWRGTLDPYGRYWIGDVGADGFEELNLVTEPGQNFGWPECEGPCDPAVEGLRDPVTSFTHSDSHDYLLDDPDAQPASFHVGWVSPMYEDRGNDRYDGRLTDRVLFGDLCVGWVRAIQVDDGHLVLDAHAGHLEYPAGWAQGEDGYLYVVTHGHCVWNKPATDSTLYRVRLAD